MDCPCKPNQEESIPLALPLMEGLSIAPIALGITATPEQLLLPQGSLVLYYCQDDGISWADATGTVRYLLAGDSVLLPAEACLPGKLLSDETDCEGFALFLTPSAFAKLLTHLSEEALWTDGAHLTDQEETVRKIHDQLTQHLDQRVTIEELSHQHLMNPTTLKAVFKSVYGTSIAAHMKKHRMEQAAEYLQNTDMSIAEIAQAVGYDSQSRFGAAFKEYYHMLPREYRQKHSGR